MKSLRFLAPLAAAVLLVLTAAVHSLCAAAIEFPPDDPAFIITFPESWKTQIAKDGTLTSQPGADSAFALTLIAMTGVEDDKATREALPRFLKRITDAGGITDLKVIGTKEGKTGKDIPMTTTEARGRNKTGGELVVTAVVFMPEEGDYYALVSVATPEEDQKHGKEATAILDSVTTE